MTRCPSCGEENPSAARFCSACGTRLSAGGSAPPEERRIVTVLFCDLVGFTERADLADPEDVKATLLPYHARLREEIERFGGTLDKFVGDAALGVFGAPVAHEDDPERAVRAGLAIQGAMASLEVGGVAMAARVGIATGEAVVAFGAGPQIGESVTGDVVNTASRIQSVAAPGTVGVEEETFRATEECFEYRSVGKVPLKGKSEPIAIWRAVAVRSAVASGPASRTAVSTAFVGRAEELSLLQNVYRRALRPTAQFVTVSGEPGVGKSRLLEEFREWAESDASPEVCTWREGRCLPYGEGITFWALGEILKAEAGVLESDPPEAAASKLAEAVAGVIRGRPERAWYESRLAPLLGIGGGATVSRAESFAAWRGFLQALAERGPLVLAFEDLHWADDALLGFLQDLLSRANDIPLVVLAAARPELYERDPRWSGGIPNATTVTLAPLSDDETARLVSDLLGRAVLPADTQSLLLERAGGNPLYAEEFVRMLTDRGLIDERGSLTSDLSELAFPPSVHALIASRLDALPPEHRALVQDASVIGKVFWAGAVASLGGMSEGDVATALQALARREIVRPNRPSSVEGQSEFSFWHLLVRDVAYAQLPRIVRSRKHLVAAEWIERAAGERVADHAEVLAHHATQALDLARASGETEALGPMEDAARRYLRMAGERAMSLDVARAEAHLRAVLELSREGDPDRPRALTALAHAEFQAGRMEQAENLFEAAVDGFAAVGREVEAADAMVGRFRVLQYRGHPAQARALLAEASRALEAAGPGPELLRARTETVGVLMTSGRHREAVDESARAIDLARSLGDAEQEVRVRGFRGYSKVGLGEREGLEEERAALDDAIALGLGRTAAVAYNNLAVDLRMVETPAAALDCYRAGIEFSERRGIEEMAAWMRMTALLPLIDLGEWDEVLAASDAVIDTARTRGAGYDEAFAEGLRALVLAHRGRAREEPLERSLAQARAIADPQVLINALAAGAVARLAWGDRDTAAGLVDEAMAATAAAGADIRAWNLPDLARVASAAGRRDLAEGLMDGIHDSLVRYRLALGSAGAALAEAEGDLERAESLHQEGADGWGAYGHAMERGLSLLGRGRALAGLGRGNEALPVLGEARNALAALRAAPHVAEADGWLERAGSAIS
jgi:predicted ATPase/class 3 adenylate cyclase